MLGEVDGDLANFADEGTGIDQHQLPAEDGRRYECGQASNSPPTSDIPANVGQGAVAQRALA